MSFSSDPPRLRTLGRLLPDELVRAVEPSPEEEATPETLVQLREALRARLSEPSLLEDARRVPARRGARVASRRTFGLATMFALGAAAGVIVASAAYFAERRDAHRETTAGVPSARQRDVGSAAERSAPSRAPSESASAATSASSSAEPVAPVLPGVRAHAAPTAESEPAEVDRSAETAILTRAQAALETDAGRALALTSDHERRYPRGVLAQEREVIAIDALIRLGRRSEAQARADAFHRRYPNSVHGRRIDVLLGDASFAPSDHN